MTLVKLSELVSCDTEWLAGTRTSPYWFIIWPSCISEGERPCSCSGKEVALSKFCEVFRFNINNAPFVYIAGCNMAGLDEVAYPKQTSDNNGVITWSGTVITRGVINYDDDYSDIIVELPPIWWSWLDEIVNRDLPESP